MRHLTNYAVLIVDGQGVLKWEPPDRLGIHQYNSDNTSGLLIPNYVSMIKSPEKRAAYKNEVKQHTALSGSFPQTMLAIIWTKDPDLQARLVEEKLIVSAKVVTLPEPKHYFLLFNDFLNHLLRDS